MSPALIWGGIAFILFQSVLITLLVFNHIKRRKAREALMQSERRFRDITSISSDWFWELDENHRLTDLSDRYEKVTRQAVSSQLGTTYLVRKTELERRPERRVERTSRGHQGPPLFP